MSQHSPSHALVFGVPDGDELHIRYYLPSGKLGEINDLMVRQDVPVLVSPSDDYIVVIGTPETQHRFYSFVTLIHPEGVKAVNDESEEVIEPVEPAAVSPRGDRQQRDRESRQLRRQAPGPDHQQRSQLHERAAESVARLNALRSQSHELRSLDDAAQLHAGALRTQAQRLQRQSDGLRDQLTQAREAARKAAGSSCAETGEMVARLEADAARIEERALELARRAEQFAMQSAGYAQQLESLESLSVRARVDLESLQDKLVGAENRIRERIEQIRTPAEPGSAR